MLPRARYTLRLPGNLTLHLGDRTLVMGILNVTPDSFADGGVHLDADRAAEAALALEAAGADIIDIGGESTRPGAAELSSADEAGRIIPVLRRLRPQLEVPISVDTYKAEVARQALDEGAALVNDVSALRYDPDLGAVVAAAGVPLVLMHMRGRSNDMYRQAVYADVVQEVVDELGRAVDRAIEAGISRDQLILDPGLGFAKRSAQTFEVLGRLEALTALDRPILVGPSRKSFLQDTLGECPPDEREWGTAGAVASAVLLGAHIVRVHGVRAMTQVVRVSDRVAEAAGGREKSSTETLHPAPDARE